jgi:hypothetical protein
MRQYPPNFWGRHLRYKKLRLFLSIRFQLIRRRVLRIERGNRGVLEEEVTDAVHW